MGAAEEVQVFVKKKKQKKPAEMRPAARGDRRKGLGEDVDAEKRALRGQTGRLNQLSITPGIKDKKGLPSSSGVVVARSELQPVRINNTKKEERVNIEQGKDGARSNNARKKRDGKANKTHELDGELPCSPFQGVMVEPVLEDTVEPQVTQVDSLPADRQGAPSNQRQNKRGNKNDITTATEEKQAFDQKMQKKVAAQQQTLQKTQKNNEDRRIEQNDKVERGETLQKHKEKHEDRMTEQNDAVERGETLQKSKKNNEDRRIEQNDKVERGETLQKSKKNNEDRRI